MAVLPTVEIHSWKDPGQKWIINADDFDSSEHVRWGGPVPANPPDPELLSPAERAGAPTSFPPAERAHTPMRPSAPDYVHDDDGNIIAVNIINPNQRNARLEIPFSTYDPDVHELWSSHSRFQ